MACKIGTRNEELDFWSPFSSYFRLQNGIYEDLDPNHENMDEGD